MDERLPGSTVLIVDDEPQIAELVRFAVEAQGHHVLVAGDSDSAWAALTSTPIDLVVLDVMLGEESGVDLCRRIREVSRIPVIMLTAKGDTDARVTGLEAGADDYMGKPFSPRELVLRIQALLRRRTFDPQPAMTNIVHIGDIRLDLNRLHATWNGEDLRLTQGEFRLLLTLSNHRGYTVRWQDLFASMTNGKEFGGKRAVTMAVYRLRAKLGERPSSPRILTDHGVGYRLVCNAT